MDYKTFRQEVVEDIMNRSDYTEEGVEDFVLEGREKEIIHFFGIGYESYQAGIFMVEGY